MGVSQAELFVPDDRTPKLGFVADVAELLAGLTERVVKSLKAHRHLRGERVFCNEDGSELTPGQLEVSLRFACRHAKLKQYGWHVLRHTFGSTLAQRGAPPKALQELMGHSDMATTMRSMHLAPSHHVDAIRLLDGRSIARALG